MITRGVEWGPVGTWAGAIATVLVVITTALVALGYFDSFRGPRLRFTFEATEPWCRQGCLGRLISVATNGTLRPDVDPVQLRWAGCPARAPLTRWTCAVTSASISTCCAWLMGRGDGWSPSRTPDFDPGFAIDLPLDQRHVLRFSVFSDNAHTVTRSLVAEVGSGDGEVKLQLK